MQPDLVREIAEAIVRDLLISNWRFYAVLLCVVVVGTSLGVWITSYFKKRAETAAQKSDMEEILRQLKQTTQATEQVRVAIGRDDWQSREWCAIRRVKLEELLEAAFSLSEWLTRRQRQIVFGDQIDIGPDPIQRLRIIGKLYFSELEMQIIKVVRAHQAAQQHILETAQSALSSRLLKEATEFGKILSDSMDDWGYRNEISVHAIEELATAASQLMEKIGRPEH